LPDYFSNVVPVLKKECELPIINHSTSCGITVEQDSKLDIERFLIFS